MKIGKPFKQSEAIHESIDDQVRGFTGRDLYWHIDTVVWEPFDDSTLSLCNAIYNSL
jgi:hypothetical protein